MHCETINVVRNFLNKYIPPKDDHSSNGSIDRNLRSTVLKLSNSSINLILGGDACNISWEEVISRIKKYQYSPITGEKIKYTSRIIKVSHHGARNASSEDTLKHILDEKELLHFIFSAGLNRNYLHPHDEVIERIEKVAKDKNSEVFHYSTNGYRERNCAEVKSISWPIFLGRKQMSMIENKLVMAFTSDGLFSILPISSVQGRFLNPNLIAYHFKIIDKQIEASKYVIDEAVAPHS